ncbi:MAG: NADH-quinone oxidoreductase subunit N, partial [Gemmobacter sp.]
MTPADLSILLPEIVLALLCMAALLGAVYTAQDRLTPTLTWGAAALFLALAAWVGTTGGDRIAFGGLFVDDAFSRFAKVVILVSAAA